MTRIINYIICSMILLSHLCWADQRSADLVIDTLSKVQTKMGELEVEVPATMYDVNLSYKTATTGANVGQLIPHITSLNLKPSVFWYGQQLSVNTNHTLSLNPKVIVQQVSGVLLDDITYSPIVEADVELFIDNTFMAKTVTDAKGNFSFFSWSIKKEDRLIKIKKNGFANKQVAFKSTSNEKKVIVINSENKSTSEKPPLKFIEIKILDILDLHIPDLTVRLDITDTINGIKKHITATEGEDGYYLLVDSHILNDADCAIHYNMVGKDTITRKADCLQPNSFHIIHKLQGNLFAGGKLTVENIPHQELQVWMISNNAPYLSYPSNVDSNGGYSFTYQAGMEKGLYNFAVTWLKATNKFKPIWIGEKIYTPRPSSNQTKFSLGERIKLRPTLKSIDPAAGSFQYAPKFNQTTAMDQFKAIANKIKTKTKLDLVATQFLSNSDPVVLKSDNRKQFKRKQMLIFASTYSSNTMYKRSIQRDVKHFSEYFTASTALLGNKDITGKKLFSYLTIGECDFARALMVALKQQKLIGFNDKELIILTTQSELKSCQQWDKDIIALLNKTRLVIYDVSYDANMAQSLHNDIQTLLKENNVGVKQLVLKNPSNKKYEQIIRQIGE